MLHLFSINSEFEPKYINNAYWPERPSAEWFGALTEFAKVAPTPDVAGVTRLLNFDVPGPKTMVRQKRRPALHLTITAPKEISVLALAFGDTRLLAAHEDAVRATLVHLESMAECRETSGGVTEISPAAGLISAVFHCAASRNHDPLIHSQVILFNITQTKQVPMWRALRLDPIFDAQKLLGLGYRIELANRVATLGYRPVFDNKGFLTVGLVKPALLKRFSSRQQQIKLKASQLGDVPLGEMLRQRNVALAQLTAPCKPQKVPTLIPTWQQVAHEVQPEMTLPTSTEPRQLPQGSEDGSILSAICSSYLAHRSDKPNTWFGVRRVRLLESILLIARGAITLPQVSDVFGSQITQGNYVLDSYPVTVFTPDDHFSWKGQKCKWSLDSELKTQRLKDRQTLSRVHSVPGFGQVLKTAAEFKDWRLFKIGDLLVFHQEYKTLDVLECSVAIVLQVANGCVELKTAPGLKAFYPVSYSCQNITVHRLGVVDPKPKKAKLATDTNVPKPATTGARTANNSTFRIRVTRSERDKVQQEAKLQNKSTSDVLRKLILTPAETGVGLVINSDLDESLSWGLSVKLNSAELGALREKATAARLATTRYARHLLQTQLASV